MLSKLSRSSLSRVSSRSVSLTSLFTLSSSLRSSLPSVFTLPSASFSSSVTPSPGILSSSPIPESREKVERFFGVNVFDRRSMKAYLSPTDYNSYCDAVYHNRSMHFSTADAIAAALLRWATERGATHFTHWFQPITGQTAEKHDTFIDTQRDGETPLTRLTGKQLLMGEPDGSSFPSGGLRATHVARGYTAWDPHSPPFILTHGNGATLYIPSCFFSWDKSAALDEKIPLLRSETALSRETLRLFDVLEDRSHTHVHMDSGLEQEFFLIDRQYYLKRPDLMVTGRTMLGAAPPKGQELEDQYFGHISNRFIDCIHEFELECWKLGIPIQTRHREVAPGQYEVAPKFAPANVGVDRNLIMMELLKKTARKHNLAALLHEKPFKGVNGSGKHNNWSLGSNEQGSLLTPGPKPENNSHFMMFLAATIRAIDVHADLMRVAITGVGNDHRLGANEAPPAIVSCYLGDDIELALDRFISGDANSKPFDSKITIGVHALPDLHRVSTDRNRTSTFAFTGNKFEFRAVGASHNPSRSNQVLNTIVAESIRHMANEIEKLKKSGVKVQEALKRVTQETLKKHRRVIFNGNGYSQEWEAEAARRGLPNLKTTPQALDTFFSKKNVELYESMHVLSGTELEARSIILYEEYIKKLSIEAKVLVKMVQTLVVPAVIQYQTQVAAAIAAAKASGLTAPDGQIQLLNTINQHLNVLITQSDKLFHTVPEAHHQPSVQAGAHFAEKQFIPIMNELRASSDKLETIVPAAIWPLPTYHQMLFHQD